MNRSADAIVVGAGPAGSGAAWFLADAGHSVLLLERRRFPREKACGEGILPSGVAVLERMGVADALREAGARPLRGIRYHAPGGRSAVGTFPGRGAGMGVRRRVLDSVLLEAARAKPGVRFEENFSVRELIRDAEGGIAGVIGSDRREFRAPLTIGADGTHSIVRKKSGLDGSAPLRRAMRVHFRLAEPETDDSRVDVYLGGGRELYVTPVAPGEYGAAWLAGGAPDPRDRGGSAETRIREALARRGGLAAKLAEAPAVSAAMAASGTGATANCAVVSGLLLIGDAAGSPDPITGMGISFALRCASLLPAATKEAFRTGDFSARRLRGYARVRRSEVARGFALTRGVLWIAARDARAEWAVRALAAAPQLFGMAIRAAA